MQYQQNSTDFLFEMDKFTLKFVWKFKVSRIVKTILKKMNKFGGLSICDYKAYFKPIVLRQCGNSIGKNKDRSEDSESGTAELALSGKSIQQKGYFLLKYYLVMIFLGIKL